jgi:hypothetical protein
MSRLKIMPRGIYFPDDPDGIGGSLWPAGFSSARGFAVAFAI